MRVFTKITARDAEIGSTIFLTLDGPPFNVVHQDENTATIRILNDESRVTGIVSGHLAVYIYHFEFPVNLD